jgi:hypothetical protein
MTDMTKFSQWLYKLTLHWQKINCTVQISQ